MRILFATTRRYPPDRHGGAQNSAHALLTRLVARGHACEVAAVHPPNMRLLLKRIAHAASGRRWFGAPDHLNGYPVRRVAPWHLAALVARRVERMRPDAIVTDHPELIPTLDRLGAARDIPTVLRVADVSFRRRPEAWPRLARTRLFANSEFIRTELRDAIGVDAPVLYPIVDPDCYRTERNDPDWITFVNPIEGKGLDVVLAVAERLPEHRFVLVSGWPRMSHELETLRKRVDALPNVQLHAWTSDMRTVYARTRLLLFPAQWDEGFGRVVLEAHASGIPVVASGRGGLPEAVGDGGHVLSHDAPAEQWAAAVDRILREPALYSRLSENALANVRRPEFDADRVTDRFLDLLRSGVATQPGAVS